MSETERMNGRVGEKESKRRATNWSKAACCSFGLGLSCDATKLARSTTIPRRESCPASRWEQLLNTRTARKERERARDRERDREREAELAQLLSNFYVLRGLSCWSASDTLNGFGKFKLISSLEIRASDASENYVCECYVRAIRGAIFTRVTRLPIPGKALCEKYLVANW